MGMSKTRHFDRVFEPLRDLDSFRQVRVEPDIGTTTWPNGADLCPDVLYENSRPAPAVGAPTPIGAEDGGSMSAAGHHSDIRRLH